MDQDLTLSLIVILAAIALSPLISRYTRIPVIVIEIIIGIIIGKSLFDIVPSNTLFDFFSSFGLIYLMFLAGLEINFGKVRHNFYRTLLIAGFSLVIPFAAGYGLSYYIGINPLILGTIFSTTSIGLILPLYHELDCSPKFKNMLLGSVILVDTLSIFILAFTLTFITGEFTESFIYSFIFILILFVIPIILNKTGVRRRFGRILSRHTRFSLMTRVSFALLILLATISHWMGFHSIIGAFLAGLIISELTHRASLLNKKLSSFGYGFFIPFFFIIVGAKIDFPELFSNLKNIEILLAIILVGILAKIIGVAAAAKLSKFDNRESMSMGFLHSARLSLIIAVGEIGFEMGLVNENLFSSLVILAMVSALIGPTVGKVILSRRNNHNGEQAEKAG